MKKEKSKVSLIKGENRKENILKALGLIRQDIFNKAKDKTIVIKPNFVSDSIQLASSHVDAVEAVIDFFQENGFMKIVVAEASAHDTKTAFKNFNYYKLQEKKISLIDLNEKEYTMIDIGIKVPVTKMLLDKNHFIVSLAIPKTHDTVIATLSLKNILMGSIVNCFGNQKIKMHQGIKEINAYLSRLAKNVYPDLAIIDGFEGMEGNGPVHGTLIETKFAIASLDSLAADRVCLECMGISSEFVGYLNLIAEEQLGNFELRNIKILGNKIEECKKQFKLHESFEEQLKWK